MPTGYFELVITVRNTGQTAFDSYVGLSVFEGAQQFPGFWAKKKTPLAAGQSSTVRLTTGMRNWASGSHSYLVRMYNKVHSQGIPWADYGDWTIYEYGTGAPDESAIVAEKTGIVYASAAVATAATPLQIAELPPIAVAPTKNVYID